MTLKHLLVPVDFSKASFAGLDYAVDLAKRFTARLTVLYVVEPIYYGGDFGVLLEDHQRFAREQLSQLERRLKKRGVPFETRIVTGTPSEQIAREADRLKVDLIVMATHGRGALSHLLLGSVAERAVRTASRPVLTIRPRARARHRP